MAGWLYRCGLDLGEDFYEATYGNPRGHFEDLDFVGFHKRLLADQGIDFVLKPDQTIALPHEATRQAYALLREKSGRAQWGFKDPRTSLFLEFWSARLAKPKVLAMVRPWPAVVDSLLRRDLRQPAKGLKKSIIPYWHNPKNRLLVNRYLGTWIRYNEAILAYADQHPEDVCFVPSPALPKISSAVFHHLTKTWDFRLEEVMHAPQIKAQKKLEERANAVWEAIQSRVMFEDVVDDPAVSPSQA
jgi:hypothetical protein